MAMVERVEDRFEGETLDPIWNISVKESGRVEKITDRVKLRIPAHDRNGYHTTQLDDYAHIDKRDDYPWTPPVEMAITARFSHPIEDLKGTAGFGFWNHPYKPGGLPRLPRALWFFIASQENNMKLDLDVPGNGFKSATFDSQTIPFLSLLPFAPIGFLLMRIKPLYRKLWPIGQRAIRVSEKALNHIDITETHTYRLNWFEESVEFYVDDQLVHHAPYSPKGPLGFCAWIDNQFAVITPQGKFRLGLVDREDEQFLLIDYIKIRNLEQKSL